jgi:hypothetical protein
MGKPASSDEEGLTGNALFPSVAISDFVNAAAHAYAAWLVLSTSTMAGLGFALVAIAAFIGTLRFGVSARLFRPANEGLADLAAFVGLPLIGYECARLVLPTHLWIAAKFVLPSSLSNAEPLFGTMGLVVLLTILRGMPPAAFAESRKLIATALFIVPVIISGWTRGNWLLVSCSCFDIRLELCSPTFEFTSVVRALYADRICASICYSRACGEARAPSLPLWGAPGGLVSRHDWSCLGGDRSADEVVSTALSAESAAESAASTWHLHRRLPTPVLLGDPPRFTG